MRDIACPPTQDHVLTDLRERFDQVLADLEAVAGWKTARIRRAFTHSFSLAASACHAPRRRSI
jgi:hypothetical protein